MIKFPLVSPVDDSVHYNYESLHEHLKEARYKRSSFYEKFYPVYDVLTGEKIPFKESHMHDIPAYFAQEFASKENMKRWFKENPEEGRGWAINWLLTRKEEKKLVYAPSQVELKSLMCPSMFYYENIGGYYNITSKMGFKERYINEVPRFDPNMSSYEIIQDTREQNPLKLANKVVVAKVNAGDYALSDRFDKGIYVERKSMNDFCGTLSTRKVERVGGEDSSYARFERELIRATEKGNYIVMMVEETLENALKFDKLPYMKHAKASPSYIFKNLRDLLIKYPLSFQVIFVNGRAEAAEKLIKIFAMGQQVRKVDLQFAYERKLL